MYQIWDIRAAIRLTFGFGPRQHLCEILKPVAHFHARSFLFSRHLGVTRLLSALVLLAIPAHAGFLQCVVAVSYTHLTLPTIYSV